MAKCISAVLCLCILVATTAVSADVFSDCGQSHDGPVQLHACSEIIAGTGYNADHKASAYRNRGNARVEAGALPHALADFAEAVRLQPAEASSYAGRGRVRLALQDLDGAIADYNEALRLAPANPTFLVSRGHAYFLRRDTTVAIADFSEALRLRPISPGVLNRRGLAYRRAGDLARAIEDYTAAIAMNPVYALAYNNRGYVYETQGRKDDAVSDFRVALLLDPSLIGARDGLRRLGVSETELVETRHRVEQGRKLVEQRCIGCHAIGVTGASPNKKAPEFRNLHARHPNLALREPLSRGIAAPHDEMPKFVLSAADIDTIVAYINNLLSAETRFSTTEAADGGDVRKGFAYAEKRCASCHNLLNNAEPSPNRQATPLKAVANTPGMSVIALTVWSVTSHPTMPNLVIDPADLDDVIAYILSLRDK